MAKPKNKKAPCPTCGGSGQISFFQGESRFLLTEEECPVCSGLGHLVEDDNLEIKTRSTGNRPGKK